MFTTDLTTTDASASSRIRFSRLGIEFAPDVTLEEWGALADKIGEAARSIGFIAGDWLVFGEERFGQQQTLPGIEVDPTPRRVKSASSEYQRILTSTGLDATTIQNYIYVSRNVPRRLRSERLSWEHHKAVAKLPPTDQQRWIKLTESRLDKGETISSRRLRKSIIAGKLLTPEELIPDASDRGIENHIPFVNRLVAWWSRLRDRKWLAKATPEQRETLKRDLKPIVDMYQQL